MRSEPNRWGRVLAIDPTHRGFGFAVLEESGRLVDWGVRDMSGRTPAAWLRAVVDLVEWYLPDAVAVEDCRARESRRGRHACALNEKVLALAKKLRLGRCRVRPRAVRLACAGSPTATKEQVALALAGRFLELAPRLPPHRKAWMSEDYRMAIFDAVGIAIAALSGAHHTIGSVRLFTLVRGTETRYPAMVEVSSRS